MTDPADSDNSPDRQIDSVEFPKGSGNVLHIPHPTPPESSPVTEAPKARLAVMETVYAMAATGAVHSLPAETRFSRWLESDEPPYLRPEFKVGTEWVELDLGWIEHLSAVGMLSLLNKLPVWQVQPTPEQRTEAEARIIEIGVPVTDGMLMPMIVVRPGESCRFEPSGMVPLWIRSRADGARLTIVVIPK